MVVSKKSSQEAYAAGVWTFLTLSAMILGLRLGSRQYAQLGSGSFVRDPPAHGGGSGIFGYDADLWAAWQNAGMAKKSLGQKSTKLQGALGVNAVLSGIVAHVTGVCFLNPIAASTAMFAAAMAMVGSTLWIRHTRKGIVSPEQMEAISTWQSLLDPNHARSRARQATLTCTAVPIRTRGGSDTGFTQLPGYLRGTIPETGSHQPAEVDAISLFLSRILSYDRRERLAARAKRIESARIRPAIGGLTAHERLSYVHAILQLFPVSSAVFKGMCLAYAFTNAYGLCVSYPILVFTSTSIFAAGWGLWHRFVERT